MSTPINLTSQPANQPTSQPANQPTSQPANQPANQPASQPANQPASQPANQPATNPPSQPAATRWGGVILTVQKRKKTVGPHARRSCFKSNVFYRDNLCAEIMVILSSIITNEAILAIPLRRGAPVQIARCPFLYIFRRYPHT
jgi:hypothetical protein